MCRFAGYIGSGQIPLSSVLYDPAHSLEKVAYAPQELISGHVNVDGTGVVWWPKGDNQPMRYVTDKPPWSDPNLPHLAPKLTGSPVLAGVRSATPGIPYGYDGVAPFVSGGLAGAHNGWIGGFRGRLGRTLLAGLSDETFADMAIMSDSLALFLLIVETRRTEPGLALTDAIRRVLDEVSGVVASAGESATLNLAIASNSEIVVSRASVAAPFNSLYWLRDGRGNWVASEPLDRSGLWEPVPENALISLTERGVEIVDLEQASIS
jgi:glutamine amidotransferase